VREGERERETEKECGRHDIENNETLYNCKKISKL
jgi:hypothetical protein